MKVFADTIRMQEPFDAHVHLRDGAMLEAVARLTYRNFPGGALVMPNLATPITTPLFAREYKKRIRQVIGDDAYSLVMTGYLTEDMGPKTVIEGFESGDWQAMKFYPRGMTTNSHGGIGDIKKLVPIFEAMQEAGMPALFHGESPLWARGEKTDIYDREKAFFYEVAPWILETFPGLRVSFEHGSTRAFVSFMHKYGKKDRVVGTITAHHLLFDRNDFFAQGPDVHLHCYPVLKRAQDRDALRKLATAGHDFIFAGTDSAPHPTDAKEKACGCAGGVFTAHAAVELYTEVFEKMEP